MDINSEENFISESPELSETVSTVSPIVEGFLCYLHCNECLTHSLCYPRLANCFRQQREDHDGLRDQRKLSRRLRSTWIQQTSLQGQTNTLNNRLNHLQSRAYLFRMHERLCAHKVYPRQRAENSPLKRELECSSCIANGNRPPHHPSMSQRLYYLETFISLQCLVRSCVFSFGL